jgi:4,5-DOPA dioxygenase extradiol
MLSTLFIAHGSPMLAVEEDSYALFLRELGASLAPRAVIVLSAHWTAPGQLVSGAAHPPLIYDFYGFPDELYRIRYAAPGHPDLARDIVDRLNQRGVAARLDPARGWDHGAWVILRLMFPGADVPVVEMSVDPRLGGARQYAIGQALADYRADDILIIGSGGTVHNLRAVDWDGDGTPVSWAVGFDEWLREVLEHWDLDHLFRYRELSPDAAMAVPVWGPEHFVPLIYAMGAADGDQEARRLFQAYQMGSLSLAVWQFGRQ